jgi:hypothetical protein
LLLQLFAEKFRLPGSAQPSPPRDATLQRNNVHKSLAGKETCAHVNPFIANSLLETD